MQLRPKALQLLVPGLVRVAPLRGAALDVAWYSCIARKASEVEECAQLQPTPDSYSRVSETAVL